MHSITKVLIVIAAGVTVLALFLSLFLTLSGVID